MGVHHCGAEHHAKNWLLFFSSQSQRGLFCTQNFIVSTIAFEQRILNKSMSSENIGLLHLRSQ